jgi:hypothetical protein
MGTTRPKIEDLTPMIYKVDKRLSGLSNMMSYSARLVTIKAVIATMPNHAMCAMKVHFTHIDHVEKACRIFLWQGKDIHKSGKCLVSWEKVCLPKKAGGLGVLDLRQQNKALQMKNLYKFYSRQDIPWVNLIWAAYYQHGKLPENNHQKGSFWWKDCTSLIATFKDLFSCQIGDGQTIYLWHDIWQQQSLKDRFPHLFSFAKDKLVTVKDAKNIAMGNIFDLFNIPLSNIASQQCNELGHSMMTIGNNETANDIWTLGQNGKAYSTKKVYNALSIHPVAPLPFKWIWSSAALPKQKFFFWLLVQDRLNTKDMMERKSFYVQCNRCVLCDDRSIETMAHLFFHCDFSRNFWWKIGMEWNEDMDHINMMIDGERRSNNIFFKEAFISG